MVPVASIGFLPPDVCSIRSSYRKRHFLERRDERNAIVEAKQYVSINLASLWSPIRICIKEAGQTLGLARSRTYRSLGFRSRLAARHAHQDGVCSLGSRCAWVGCHRKNGGVLLDKAVAASSNAVKLPPLPYGVDSRAQSGRRWFLYG